MKRLFLPIAFTLLYSLNSVLTYAAPVSGIGSLSLNKTGIQDFFLGIDTLIRFDHQQNSFPKQIDQFLYKPPGSTDDKRHYSKTRESENYLDLFEIETGLNMMNFVYIYAKAGAGKFYSELYLLDEKQKGLYEKPDLYKITDNFAFSYGGGASFNIFKCEVLKVLDFIEGHVDIQYRRILIDTGSRGVNSLSYEAEFDEIQASFLAIGWIDKTKFFIGPRISSITGNERLKIEKTGFNYDESIKTSENRGWVYGLNFVPNEKYSVSLQKRTGDEEGVSFEVKINFF